MSEFKKWGVSTLEVLLIMGAGICIGHWVFPKKYRVWNEKLQLFCTIILIFAMGLTLGSREHILEELSIIGGQSILFCLLPSLCSIILVYILSRWLLQGNKEEERW